MQNKIMCGLTKPISGKLGLARFAVFALALQAMVFQSRAQYTLTDGNSQAQIDPSTQLGTYSWTVDGQDQLYQQWFWYRVGTVNPESSIDTISTPTVSSTAANNLTTTYANNSFSIKVLYTLQGGAAGSGVADMSEQITINNTSGASLNFHFFQYVDFDLAGDPPNDTVQLGKNLSGLFNEARQTDGLRALSETVDTPGANHAEANVYPNTLNKLNDGAPTVLSDNAGPVGPDNVTWAFQWDINLTASGTGSSFVIGKQKHLDVGQVPEPSALAIIALGLIACLLRTTTRQRA